MYAIDHVISPTSATAIKPSARGARMVRVFAAFMGIAVATIIGGVAEAQQPAKSGKYTGKFASHLVAGAGQAYELEKGHVFFLGPTHGLFLNDVADSFLDKSEVMCPLVQDIVGGVIIASHGYCIVTDKDGDKAFLVWEGKETAPQSGGGPFKWTGGTGKYAGLQGNNTFHYAPFGKAGAAVVLWEGEWRLP